MGCHALPPGDLPNPGIEPRFPKLQADSLPSAPPGEPKNTAVGSLIPSPEDLSDPGIKLGSPALEADSLPVELAGKPNHKVKSLKKGYTKNRLLIIVKLSKPRKFS